ncbi:MAG TPA: SDR family NAD(P)-dependent oxidoreductase [Abditibacterium sp.]|jgi:NAD(P)-dependent dehydrogenase (short-subunit alcohol dehydrogenase family)
MTDLEITLQTLQKWADDPSLIAEDARAKTLIAKIHREGARGAKKAGREARQARDRAKIEATGRVAHAAPSLRALPAPPNEQNAELERARVCPTCRATFSQLHPFYHAYCPDCAAFNWEKRHQSGDLSGRIALLTGGRIKIGFECALKLLRCGARVIVTTRFARDAAQRYAAQSDFADWRHRLQIVALDLRFLGEIERFCAHLDAELPHLDILINNAAQTIARPPQFYAHLLQNEPALMAKSGAIERLDALFPPNQFDGDGQQLDLRAANSWTAHLGEIEALEAAQCYVVTALAPFVLTGQLRPLLKRSSFARRFVVQASAMEGNFSRGGKTTRHPHTNMAKAALNMMVRTSAPDLQRDEIWCNAVDTGWITDENPHSIASNLRQEGFVPPLDAIDGAARLLDPIFMGLDESLEPPCGQFLKDYRPHAW